MAEHVPFVRIPDEAWPCFQSASFLNSVQVAIPYIPLRAKNSRRTGKSEAWRLLYHTFETRNDEFLACYHRRSNAESTFSMVKRLFGASVRAKTFAAQVGLIHSRGHFSEGGYCAQDGNET
jgi:transposase